jgi:hypothetical protein
VGIVTVRQLEAGSHHPRRATLSVLRRAFEDAGVEFIDENGGGPGVRLRSPSSAARSAAVQINYIAGISIGNCDPILANVAKVNDAE